METALQSVQFSLNVILWAFGLGFVFFFSLLTIIWMSINKRIDKLDDRLSTKVEDIDRRLCRIEGSLATQGHCLFSQDKPEKKKVE